MSIYLTYAGELPPGESFFVTGWPAEHPAARPFESWETKASFDITNRNISQGVFVFAADIESSIGKELASGEWNFTVRPAETGHVWSLEWSYAEGALNFSAKERSV